MFFFEETGLNVFEVAGEQEFDEVVAMEVGDVAIVPEQF